MEKLKQLVALAIFVIFLVMSFIIGLDKENERPTQGLTAQEIEQRHKEDMSDFGARTIAEADRKGEKLPSLEDN